MATKKKLSGLNFRPNLEKQEGKGTRPLPEPTPVKNIFLLVVQHVCRRLLFFNTNYRVAIYLIIIFIVSVITDFAPAGKQSAVRKDSFFNTYFVKIGWGWTLLLTLPFVSITSFVYSCGSRDKVIKHTARLLVATLFWYSATALFNYIEKIYGRCNVKDPLLQNKVACLRKGNFWQSVDISGHCFILIYSTLIIIEECRVICGWEGIADFIRDEEHNRSIDDKNNRNPLSQLSSEEFTRVTTSYVKLTPLVRILFIAMTLLTILWDFMLIGTVLFYHSMLEKLLGGLTAIAIWYITYCFWFKISGSLPPCPGEGSFKYNNDKNQTVQPITKRRQTLISKNANFLGMPLRVSQEERNNTNHT